MCTGSLAAGLSYRDSTVHATRPVNTIKGNHTNPGLKYGGDIFHGQPPG
jgi:hypothetical protein